MFSAITLPTPRLQMLPAMYSAQGVSVQALRLDELHPVISGNKWYKLKNYIAEALAQNKKGIITWGGAWSNHLVATAAACASSGLQSIGIIRGEEPAIKSAALQDCTGYGMRLIFISRKEYQQGLLPKQLFLPANDFLVVPEGGYGKAGAQGASEIINNMAAGFTHIICAVGTGTMLAGICNAAAENTSIIGVSSQKNNYALDKKVQQLLPPEKQSSFSITHDFHFGGYAKYNATLLHFMNDWFEQTEIPTDFVYTAKAFYAADALIKQAYFAEGSSILIIHSGGMQGNRGLPPHSLIFPH